jgi:DNA adenine methylase
VRRPGQQITTPFAARASAILVASATVSPARVPHPLPYQGSKRRLASAILSYAAPGSARLIEPFAGSGAITLAAAAGGVATSFLLGELYAPLAGLWNEIIVRPGELAKAYDALWRTQHGDTSHYERVRDSFNRTGEPSLLLYLLARCVKGAVRFNRAGAFNQAPDRRRCGAAPERVAREIAAASALLKGRITVRAADFADTLADAGPRDLVYLDPPYQGTSLGRDARYAAGLAPERLIEMLSSLVGRRVPFLLSYDGQLGDRVYGAPLPASLGLVRRALAAGRSSQATLLGRDEETIESLYLSPALAKQVGLLATRACSSVTESESHRHRHCEAVAVLFRAARWCGSPKNREISGNFLLFCRGTRPQRSRPSRCVGR